MSAFAPDTKNLSPWWGRGALFFLLWLIVSGWSIKDAPVGLLTALGATAVSLRLAPDFPARLRLRALAQLVLRLLQNSLLAGFDIARRSFSSPLQVDPGFVAAPLDSDPAGRNAFRLLSSLAPGALPVDAEGDELMIHALDRRLAIAENCAADQKIFGQAIGRKAIGRGETA